MNTLREALAARKGLYPVVTGCFEKDYQPVLMVTFYPWQGAEWTLPWSRLDALSFSHTEEQECIELFFSHHHIVLRGENLKEILEPLRKYCVHGLRALPASYRATLKPTEPFIDLLDVRRTGAEVTPF